MDIIAIIVRFINANRCLAAKKRKEIRARNAKIKQQPIFFKISCCSFHKTSRRLSIAAESGATPYSTSTIPFALTVIFIPSFT